MTGRPYFNHFLLGDFVLGMEIEFPLFSLSSTLEKKKADIVFLLDGSINFRRDSFQEVLRFVSEIVDTVYEGGDSIQVGLVQYNSDPTDEFFLKDFPTKQQIIDAINKVVYKGGRHAHSCCGHCRYRITALF